MPEHVHDFREPIIARTWSNHRLPMEFITGYRCACGARASYPGRPRELFSPAANLKAAAKYVMDRYGLNIMGAARPRRHEEESGMDTTIRAPRNPYRQAATPSPDGFALAGAYRDERPQGPGLLAADVDRIAREHYRSGWAERDRAAREELRDAEAESARIYDEGYTAGRVERAQGLARDVHARLFEVQVKVIEARGGPKGKAHEALDGIEAAVQDVLAFVAGLFTPHHAVAGERAAAQVARDEA
jgi:hypothetical protein